jgi:hypothetical protein
MGKSLASIGGGHETKGQSSGVVLQVLDSLALLVVVVRNRREDDPPKSRVRMLGQML